MNRTIALAIFLVSFVFVSALRAYRALTHTDSSADNNEDRGFFPVDFLIQFSVIHFSDRN